MATLGRAGVQRTRGVLWTLLAGSFLVVFIACAPTTETGGPVAGAGGSTTAGIAGTTGSQGGRGGTQGIAGTTGGNGSQGAAGSAAGTGGTGTGGTTGAAGRGGASSGAGSGGAAGTSGAAGATGAAGTTGTAGTTGASGATGAAGQGGGAGAAGRGGATGSGGASGSGGATGSGGVTGSGGTGTACPVELVGWATVGGGTTGGGSASPQRATTLADLRTLAGDGTARVIEIAGTITTDATPIEIASNKTLVGADRNATIKGGLNISDGSSNIVIRNLNILGVGTTSNTGEPVDTIAARGSHNLWFDHLNVMDGPDGLLDLTKGSDHATVSWSKFSYTTSNRDHRLALLFGGSSNASDTDTGKNNHTVHHNWFAANVDQRMPRLLFGHGHMFNNYYNAPGNLYCIGSGSWSSLLVENNYFKDVQSPHKFQDGNPSYIAASGNVYDNTSGSRDTGNGGSGSNPPGPWTPAYAYKLDGAADVPAIVQRCAGPQ